MKFAKEVSYKSQVKNKSVIKLSFLSGLLCSSFLVGCSSIDPKNDEGDAPVVVAVVASSESMEAAESATQNKRVNEKALLSASANKESVVKGIEKTNPEPVTEPAIQKITIEKPEAQTNVQVQEEIVKVNAVAEAKDSTSKAMPTVEKPSVESATVKTVQAKVVKEKTVASNTQAKAQKKQVKKSSSPKRNLNTKPLNISLKNLPITHDIWQFKQGVSALEQGVVVSTPTWEMGKQNYNSQIWVTLMENQILINSSSDIDPSAGALGVAIDGGELIPFTRIAEKNIGVLEGEWLDLLKEGGKMDIYLGFFPGKIPTSQVFKTDLNLDSLSRVVPTYRNLLK